MVKKIKCTCCLKHNQKRCPECNSSKIGQYENLMGFYVDYCKKCGYVSAMGF